MDIRISDIATAVQVSQLIPEFWDAYEEAEYHKRLSHTPHLILVAFEENQPIGFKVGYEREDYFYSWMGGILPEYRKQGVAKALAEYQENWAKEKGYTTIVFKTRNYLKGMLIFAMKNGFHIIDIEKHSEIEQHRILLQKKLV